MHAKTREVLRQSSAWKCLLLIDELAANLIWRILSADHYWWVWIGVGVLIISVVGFNFVLIWAHGFLGREIPRNNIPERCSLRFGAAEDYTQQKYCDICL